MRTRLLLTYFAAFFTLCVATHAQTPEFTYQGRLVDGSLAAQGTYEMRFRLFDDETEGTQQPDQGPITLDFTVAGGNPVTVTNGVFTVKLNFTEAAFPGSARWLEIFVRRTAADPFTPLNPRQPVTSAPHNIRSLSSGLSDGLSVRCVLCVTDGHIQSIDGAKVTGTVANATTAVNISGIVPIANGGTGSSTQNFIDLSTNQSDIGGDKTFTGVISGNGSGLTNLSGFNIAPGTVNTNQLTNLSITVEKLHPFTRDRLLFMPGTANLFAGIGVGASNTGGFNSFFGTFAGRQNTSGSGNVFFGRHAGDANDSGNDNVFLGHLAGNVNSTGSNNTVVGGNANVAAGNLNFATAIGAGSVVSSSNTIIVGRNSGADTVLIPGALSVTGSITGTISNATESVNAARLGGFDANQYVLTNDPRMSDSRFPLAGSLNYIQNLPTASTQLNSGFSISGTGKANDFDATQYKILGFPALSHGTGTSFATTKVGVGAGLNATGTFNLFVGTSTGTNNQGGNNAFIGSDAGNANVSGSSNSFLGTQTGINNVGGNSNSFFGTQAGVTNVSGSNNTLIGRRSETSASDLINATAIGSQSLVSQNNSLVLGSIFNVNGCLPSLGCDTVRVGIGTNSPLARLHVSNAFTANTTDNTAHFTAPEIGPNTSHIHYGTNGDWLIRSAASSGKVILQDTGGNVGIGTTTPNDRLEVNGIIRVSTLGAAGATTLCHNASNQIATCSSSKRYKQNMNSFSSGLSLIKMLRPVSFAWRQDGSTDLGLVAEEVAEAEPLLVTYNDKGEVEGIKYDRIGVVLINAMKEQQAEIERQQRLVEGQQKQIAEQNQQNKSLQKQIDEQGEIMKKQQTDLEDLKSVICPQNPLARFCQPGN